VKWIFQWCNPECIGEVNFQCCTPERIGEVDFSVLHSRRPIRTFCPNCSFRLGFFHLLIFTKIITATFVAMLIVNPPHVSKILDCERKIKARCYAPERCDTTPRSRAAVFTQRVNIRLVQPLQWFMRIRGERRDLRVSEAQEPARKQQ
jgi:hypothetical protein